MCVSGFRFHLKKPKTLVIMYFTVFPLNFFFLFVIGNTNILQSEKRKRLIATLSCMLLLRSNTSIHIKTNTYLLSLPLLPHASFISILFVYWKKKESIKQWIQNKDEKVLWSALLKQGLTKTGNTYFLVWPCM